MLKKLTRKFSNSTLRLKLVIIMSLLVTVTPTVLVAVLAYTYYHIGIESLFNERISRVINQSVEVAEAYLKEHRENIKADILSISKDLEKNYFTLKEDPSLFTPFLNKQAELRNLSEIMIFQRDKVIAKNSFALSLAFEKFPEQLYAAKDNEPMILSSPGEDKVRGAIKLNDFDQTYLLVGMYVDRDILNHLKNSQGSADLYQIMLKDIDNTRFQLEIAFFLFSSLLCTAAILLGMKLAKNITKPINRLVAATQKVSQGDFSVTLIERPGKDEVSILTRAFNNMTSTLDVQRKQLVQFNNVIDERRRFIEAILAEITAGVLVISTKGKITLFNYSAESLLGLKSGVKTRSYTKLFPEIEPLLEEVITDNSKIAQRHIEIIRNNKKMHLFIRIGAQLGYDNKVESYIVTFDDISDLVSAQRLAAWGDVARRIAHEIKNPLTPIQLSAERLKKKFLDSIKVEDRDNFAKYLDTIVRHVGDIGKIVEEFVEFAKIPSPKLKKCNLEKIILESMLLFQSAFKDIDYKFEPHDGKIYTLCDSGQISQVITNLLKNATESVTQKGVHGLVKISTQLQDEKFILVAIEDNGMGFDKEILDRAFEPYVTTKSEGTGLGLAIVRKIIEDHGGQLKIANTNTGAVITFTLQLKGE